MRLNTVGVQQITVGTCLLRNNRRLGSMDGSANEYTVLVGKVRAVIETTDYMNIAHHSTVSWKMSSCIHGETRSNGCEACICEYLSEAISK